MKKTIIIWTIITLLVVEFLLVIAPGKMEFVDANPKPTPIAQSPKSKLKIEDIKQGEGKAVKPGDVVVMNYKGTLADGTEFDSSEKQGRPFETTIGTGQVIKGWDEGIPGMKAGGKRKLVIPSEMAYGKEGRPPVIPPDAELTFEVELLEIK